MATIPASKRAFTGLSSDMDTTRLFEHLQLTPDKILVQYPAAELVILGDFNATIMRG
jgi:hypothetical protein